MYFAHNKSNSNFKYVINVYCGLPHYRDLWYLMFLFLVEKKRSRKASEKQKEE